MASSRLKPEISSEKLSNDFLTCPLCYDLYTSPKVLHCQHTFCLPCLRTYVRTRGFSCTLSCPICKDVTSIPQNDVSQLKNNYTIVNLLECVEESWKIAAQEKPVTQSTEPAHSSDCVSVCGACSEVKAVIRFCESCCFWLCSICTASHRRVPATSQHALQTTEEIDEICKRIANQGEIDVEKIKQLNGDKTAIILGQIEQLPAMMDAIRLKIETAGDDACHIIRQKQTELLNQLQSFQRDQHNNFSRKLHILDYQSTELSRILGLLNIVKVSSDGYQNHTNSAMIERDIRNIPSLVDFPANANDFRSLTFTPSRIEKSELKHMDLGTLHVVKSLSDQRLYLHDHSLQIHKEKMLEERVYITGLAVNKFAEKFVVANNESVIMFKPDSRQPRKFVPFESPILYKKPWGIAYCEVGKNVYLTVAGDLEGEGAVYVYSSNGMKHTILASGLTLPRGIALHNGLIYVCDQIDRCVYVLSSDGAIVKLLKKLPDGKFLFNEPMFVSVGAEGRVAVSDGYQSVKIFNKDLKHIYTYIPDFLEVELWDVLVLHDGTVVVCDWKHGLHKISRDFQSNGLISIEGNMLREPSALSSLENSNVIYVGNGMGEISSAI